MANDIDKTSPHYKGEFGSIYEVNQKFPNGGVAGDYVEIDGWAHYWNADRGTWCVNAQRDSYWDELITGIIEKFKLFKGATYMGVASLDTVPAKAIGAKMYYFATVAGTYKNFGGLVVPQGINVLYSENGSSWVCSTLLEVAQELGVSTRNVVSQKVVKDALDLKANQSSVNEALAKKANKADMDVELGKKADKAAMDVELGKKADKAAMDVELGKKADKAAMDVELGKKADKAAVDASLDLKANKSDVVKTNAAQDAEISRKANQQDVERSLNILRKEIGERTVVEGNVNNNPDEEDLTSKMGSNNRAVLSLKDREYNPLEFSGKGYKILRKNIQEVTCAITKIQVTKAPTTDGYVSLIINGVETHVDLVASTDNTIALVAKKIADKLSETMDEYVTSVDGALVTCTRRFGGDVTASSFSGVSTGSEATVSESSKTELRNLITAVMLNQSNCIYEIRYDFDLDGKTIEVPENCTLKFEGGSLGNGRILFKNTKLKGNVSIICEIDGTVSNKELPISWFTKDKGDSDNIILQRLIDFAAKVNANNVLTSFLPLTIILDKNVWIHKTIKFHTTINIKGCGKFFKTQLYVSGDFEGNNIIEINGESSTLYNIKLENFILYIPNDFKNDLQHAIYIHNTYCIYIYGVAIKSWNSANAGIYIDKSNLTRLVELELYGKQIQGNSMILLGKDSFCTINDCDIESNYAAIKVTENSRSVISNLYEERNIIGVLVNTNKDGSCTIIGGSFNAPNDSGHCIFVLYGNNLFAYGITSNKNSIYISSESLRNNLNIIGYNHKLSEEYQYINTDGTSLKNTYRNLSDKKRCVLFYIKDIGTFMHIDIKVDIFLYKDAYYHISKSANIYSPNNNIKEFTKIESSKMDNYYPLANLMIEKEGNIYKVCLDCSFTGPLDKDNANNYFAVATATLASNKSSSYIQSDGAISNLDSVIIDYSGISSGTSTIRNAIVNKEKGYSFFDTTINKPIWWTGDKWVDATGADV